MFDKCDEIYIRYCIDIKELTTRCFVNYMFTRSNWSKDWPNASERLDVEKLRNLHHCTVNLTIELIDVWLDGRNVTTNFQTD